MDTKLILDVQLFGRHGTDPAASLRGLQQKHDLSEAVFLVDGFGYQTALTRLGLSDRLDYVERNLIEKWFQTLKMRVDRFHNSWVGSRRSSVCDSLNRSCITITVRDALNFRWEMSIEALRN